MKLHSLLFLCAPLLFSLASCTKELSYEIPVGGSSDSVNFYAVIDGVAWKADSLQQVSVSDSGVLSITGIGKSQDVISMIIPVFEKGVYSVNSQTPAYALYLNLRDSLSSSIFLTNTSTDASKAGGKVTITDIDTVNKTISGTFQFNLYDPVSSSGKSVTAGFFNKLSYSGGGTPIDPGGPSGGTTGNSLKATINGTEFTAPAVVAAVAMGQLLVSGSNADGSNLIALQMPANITPGSNYSLVAGGPEFALYLPDVNNDMVSQSGTLTITQNDTVNKRIQGTFSFDATTLTNTASASITNGSFSCSYQ